MLDAGWGVERIARLVRDGSWVVVRRGVYATRAHWEALDEHHGRPLARVHAACLAMRSPHVVSHFSAARVLGLPVLYPLDEWVHVTRFGHLGGRVRHGVKHHQAPFEPWQLDQVDDVWLLDRDRTACDIAREGGLRHGLPAFDAALRAGSTLDSLATACVAMDHWPHVTAVRRSLELCDRGAETPGESLARLLVTGLHLGQVETQFGLRDEVREGWVDLRIGRHLIEFDGRVKYHRRVDGGLAKQSAEQVVWEEKRRQDWLTGFKLGMSRLTWDDLLPRNWAATQDRVAREIRDTNARFGVSIDDLAPYIVRRRR